MAVAPGRGVENRERRPGQEAGRGRPRHGQARGRPRHGQAVPESAMVQAQVTPGVSRWARQVAS